MTWRLNSSGRSCQRYENFWKRYLSPLWSQNFRHSGSQDYIGPRSGREAIIEIMQAMKVPEFADVGKNDECVNRLLETCQADVANKRWYEAANVYARWLEINWKFDFEEPEWKPTEKIQVSDHGIYVEFTLHGKKIVIENTTNQGGGSITALIRATVSYTHLTLPTMCVV